MFKKSLSVLAAAFLFASTLSAQSDSAQLKKITNEILLNGKCYQWLDYLSNRIGGRLSGSPQAMAAVEYTRYIMDSIGADSVYLMPCMVPHWIRGEKEVGKILTSNSGDYSVNICALGGSI